MTTEMNKGSNKGSKSKSKSARTGAAAPVDAAPVDAAPVDAAPVDAAPVDAAPVDAATIIASAAGSDETDTPPAPVDAAPSTELAAVNDAETAKVTYSGLTGLYGNPGSFTIGHVFSFPAWNIPRNGILDHMDGAQARGIVDSLVSAGYSPNFSMTIEPYDAKRHATAHAIACMTYLAWMQDRIESAKGIDAVASATASREWFLSTYRKKDGTWLAPDFVVVDGNTRFAAIIIANGLLIHQKLAPITRISAVKLARPTTDSERLIIQSSTNYMQGKTVPVSVLGSLAVARAWIDNGRRADKASFKELYANADMTKAQRANIIDPVWPVAILDWAFPDLQIIDRLVNPKAHPSDALTFNVAFGQFKRSELNSAAASVIPTERDAVNEQRRAAAKKKADELGLSVQPGDWVELKPITQAEVVALIARGKDASSKPTAGEVDAKLKGIVNVPTTSAPVKAVAAGILAGDTAGAIETFETTYNELLTLATALTVPLSVSILKSASKLSAGVADKVLSTLAGLSPDELANMLTTIAVPTTAAPRTGELILPTDTTAH